MSYSLQSSEKKTLLSQHVVQCDCTNFAVKIWFVSSFKESTYQHTGISHPLHIHTKTHPTSISNCVMVKYANLINNNNKEIKLLFDLISSMHVVGHRHVLYISQQWTHAVHVRSDYVTVFDLYLCTSQELHPRVQLFFFFLLNSVPYMSTAYGQQGLEWKTNSEVFFLFALECCYRWWRGCCFVWTRECKLCVKVSKRKRSEVIQRLHLARYPDTHCLICCWLSTSKATIKIPREELKRGQTASVQSDENHVSHCKSLLLGHD